MMVVVHLEDIADIELAVDTVLVADIGCIPVLVVQSNFPAVEAVNRLLAVDHILAGHNHLVVEDNRYVAAADSCPVVEADNLDCTVVAADIAVLVVNSLMSYQTAFSVDFHLQRMQGYLMNLKIDVGRTFSRIDTNGESKKSFAKCALVIGHVPIWDDFTPVLNMAMQIERRQSLTNCMFI